MKRLATFLILLLVHTPAAKAQFVNGIDVSRWQGDINWTAVKNSGVEFAFCKATEGVDFVDVEFTQNMAGASAAGVYIGPYHFARIDSNVSNPLDAVSEAHDFVDAILPFYEAGGNYLRPVLDVERLPNLSSQAANRAYLSQWVRDFVGVLEDRLGFGPIIYTSAGYAINYMEPDLAQHPLWLAHWTNTTAILPPPGAEGIWDDWTFWQYTATGSVPGIAGPVDLDVFRGTKAELLSEFLVAVPEPTGIAASIWPIALSAFCRGRRRARRRVA